MAKVPITVMGFSCDRCGHEWIPRDANGEPTVCPKCKSPYWNRPKKALMSYEEFSAKIAETLRGKSLTWTEVRTTSKLPQLFPNNKWVRRMEKDIGLVREKDSHGIIQWSLAEK